MRRPPPTGGGEAGPEVPKAPPRSGKCGEEREVPRACPRRDALVPVVWAVTLTGILSNTLVAPALPEIGEHFGVGAVGVALVVAFASLPGVVVAPVIGVLADRFGRRTVLLPCLALFGAGGAVGMVAPGFAILLGGRFLQGLGAAGLVNLAVVILGDRFEGMERARAIGRNAAVLTVGLGVLPVAGGLLAQVGTWRLSFAPYSLAFVVALAAARVLPPDRPAEVPPLREQLSGARPYLSDPRNLAMTTVGFLAFLLVFGLGLTVLPLDLDRRFGVGSATRGLLLGLPALSSVVVSLRIGPLTQRHGTWRLVLWGFAVLSTGYAVVAASPVAGLVGFGTLLWGLGEGLTIVPLQAYAAGLAPAAQRGVVVAVWVAAVRAGQTVGPPLAGAVVSATGTRAAFVAGSVAAAAVAAVGALGYRRRVR